MVKYTMPQPSKDKAKVLKQAKEQGRKVLWLDNKGLWHASLNRQNTPSWAKETEDVK